jgi:hypothetical protein
MCTVSASIMIYCLLLRPWYCRAGRSRRFLRPRNQNVFMTFYEHEIPRTPKYCVTVTTQNSCFCGKRYLRLRYCKWITGESEYALIKLSSYYFYCRGSEDRDLHPPTHLKFFGRTRFPGPGRFSLTSMFVNEQLNGRCRITKYCKPTNSWFPRTRKTRMVLQRWCPIHVI